MVSEEGVVILDEKPSEEFEPSEEEIQQYAAYLGLDPQQDHELLYLAREGLKAPLADGWKPCQNAEGHIFYFNQETGQNSWNHPADDVYKKIVRELKQCNSGNCNQLLCRRSSSAPSVIARRSSPELPPRRSRCRCCRVFRWWRRYRSAASSSPTTVSLGGT